MLFQGQEFAASAPFLYFADHHGELGDAIRKGRAEFLTQFPSMVEYERQGSLDVPNDPQTFARSKVDLTERERHAGAYRLHRDLLDLRRRERAFALQEPSALDGSVIGPDVFALRFFTSDHQEDRVLVVNLGRDCNRPSIAEPLLAPPGGADWAVIWSSEHPAYGGRGTADVWPKGGWRIPGECAIVLGPGPMRNDRKPPVRRRSA
jgi:maltooligosyltrehalose trehalohydrolase